MPAPRTWSFPEKADAIAVASRLRWKTPTFGFLVAKPKWCRGWRIAIYDTQTGQFTGWLKV
jgi:hypothetical protein